MQTATQLRILTTMNPSLSCKHRDRERVQPYQLLLQDHVNPATYLPRYYSSIHINSNSHDGAVRRASLPIHDSSADKACKRRPHIPKVLI